MTNGEDQILAGLNREYGDVWTISRICNWWKATRHQSLTNRGIEKGLDQTLICNTARQLAAQLATQGTAEQRVTDAGVVIYMGHRVHH